MPNTSKPRQTSSNLPAAALVQDNVVRATCFGRATVVNSFAPSDQEKRDLQRLRWLAMRASLSGKPDMEQACYVLSGDPDQSVERIGETFFQGLAQHTRHTLTMYRPGAAELSGDEIWLLRLFRAYRSGDRINAQRMMAWHVKPAAQRWMRFLASRLTEELSQR